VEPKLFVSGTTILTIWKNGSGALVIVQQTR
jgi:hypothetical protein